MQSEERVVSCRTGELEGFTMARMESVSSDLVLFCGVVSFGVAMWVRGGRRGADHDPFAGQVFEGFGGWCCHGK